TQGDEEERREGRAHHGEGAWVGTDEGGLEALLGGVLVEEAGLVGAEHVAGGVEAAEVDVVAAGSVQDDESPDEGHELEGKQSEEVELEAFCGEKHRGGSAVRVSWGEYSAVALDTLRAKPLV